MFQFNTKKAILNVAKSNEFMKDIKIGAADLVIIVIYIIGILAIGLFSVRKSKMTSNNYFLAGRSLKWLIVGAALFALPDFSDFSFWNAKKSFHPFCPLLNQLFPVNND